VLLSAIEQKRLVVSRDTGTEKKSFLGQFLTPEATAKFMASLFPDAGGECRLLDAGAGIGSLSAAFLDRWQHGGLGFDSVELDAFELDPELGEYLNDTFSKYRKTNGFSVRVYNDDFIMAAVEALSGNLFAGPLGRYTHVILNPPYKKINSHSAHRKALRSVGIETVNLYSAFVALALELTEPGGHVVAIIPRSFCNGPYYRSFREFVLQRAAIRRIHLFDSRNKAFKDDAVLQENVIIHLERGGEQGEVTISTSTDDRFTDLVLHQHPFERIVFPDDPGCFIHVPTSPEQCVIELFPAIRHTLADLGVRVSTGPVVDFRLKEHLRAMPEPGCVPLLYPAHFNGFTTWPIEGIKKPNAIVRNADTEKWLYPNGFYCVVRRFSSKEEKRRVVASLVDPGMFPDITMLGIENHLNVFHQDKHGLPEDLARGLVIYLNSTAVDEHFRRFSGHTQVNATDLKLIKYPDLEVLVGLGRWAKKQGNISQQMINDRLERVAGVCDSFPKSWRYGALSGRHRLGDGSLGSRCPVTPDPL
jgi:adenine-specific DNA-methyltransferase